MLNTLKKEKILIGMLVYNGEQFVGEAIESLLNQSFSNFTLFISDDASADNTRTICEGYAKKDPRIIYYRQEKNIGMFPNFKFVLDKAKEEEYFMWAAHDDLWEKDFLKVCIKNIENQKVDVATTIVANVDSYGRNLRELTDLTQLSGKPSFKQIIKYVLQPEILGKCNLMYSLFKTNVIKKVWEIYPQKMEWGSDYHFSLATISHFSIYIDKRILFKKRLGGYSSKDSIKKDDPNKIRKISIKRPKNHIFPFGRFRQYFNGHMKAVKGTYFQPIVLLLLLVRLPRAFLIHISERNLKKFIKNIFKIIKIRNNVIIIKLMGGIGNQMFQYATARRISIINNVQLKLDISTFGKEDKQTTPRVFELHNFNIHSDIASKKEIGYFRKYKKIHIKILGRIYNSLFANDSIYITERGFGFNSKILDLKDNVYLDGYWQSEKYFKDIKDILIQEFTLKNETLEYKKQLEKIKTQNSVSIHIRRGDYVSNSELLKNYGLCDLDYYHRAIKLITEKVKNPHFFIFSDDIDWAIKNLNIKHQHLYIPKNKFQDCEELILMSKCKHNIIANSSFSWWGAWLNNNENKIIITPKKWFKDEIWTPKDIIPETWTRI